MELINQPLSVTKSFVLNKYFEERVMNPEIRNSAPNSRSSWQYHIQGAVFEINEFDEAYIGELQEKWRFPSDHLPVGVQLDDFEIASWNVMNTHFMSWVYKNTQGLARSILTEEDVIVDPKTKLTIRDQHTVFDVFQMLSHPTHPKAVLALQECSPAFLQELQKTLSDQFEVVIGSSLAKDQEVLIYDKMHFDLVEEKVHYDAFACQPGRSLQNVVLKNKNTNKKYRFLNTHVPGDPNLPGTDQLANFVFQQTHEDETVIIFGDMNFNQEKLHKSFEGASDKNLFIVYSSYWTNIGPNFKSDGSYDTFLNRKTVDHIIINKGIVRILSADDTLEGLQETVDLLKNAPYQF